MKRHYARYLRQGKKKYAHVIKSVLTIHMKRDHPRPKVIPKAKQGKA